MTTASRHLSLIVAFCFAACLVCADQALGQGDRSLRDSSRTVLVTLGTQGGPLPNKSRAQIASALLVDGRVYLIDAGNGVFRQLALAEIPFLKVDHIFVTHNHDDHNADVGTLLGLSWTLGRSAPIVVHGPRGTSEEIKGFLSYFKINRDIRISDGKLLKIMPESMIRVEEIGEEGRVYQDDLVTVDAIENCHFHFPAGSPAFEAKSYAYRFKTVDKTVVFSGDTGPCDRMAEFATGADILVHEVISVDLLLEELKRLGFTPPQIEATMRHQQQDHTTPEDVGRLASKAGVKMVVLSHIAPGRTDDPDAAYSAGVSKYFSGPVVVAKDLMRF